MDGSCLRTFEGHTASALRVVFLSGGTQVRHMADVLIQRSLADHAIATKSQDPLHVLDCHRVTGRVRAAIK